MKGVGGLATKQENAIDPKFVNPVVGGVRAMTVMRVSLMLVFRRDATTVLAVTTPMTGIALYGSDN